MIESYTIERNTSSPFGCRVVYQRPGMSKPIKSGLFSNAHDAIAAMTMLIDAAQNNCGIKPLVSRWEDEETISKEEVA